MKTNNILKTAVWLLASSMSLLTMSCNDDIDNSYSRNQSVIELQPSGDYIKLDENNPDATALTLDWTTAHDYGDDYITTYKYEMRVSGSTADEIMEYEDDGHFSRSYTNQQLQELLVEHFGQLTSTIREVQFTVTASFEGPRLVVPDIATARVKVKTYGAKQFSADQLFMAGTAVGDADVLVEANNDGTVYSYTGKLSAGKINFPVLFGDEENAIGPSEADEALTLSDMPAIVTDRSEANSWIIPEDDTYRITVDMTKQTVKIVAAGAVVDADQIFLAGTAVGDQVEMQQTLENENLYAWRGQLSAGTLYIPLTYEGKQEMSIVPMQEGSHDINDGQSSSFTQVATNTAASARYWSIPSAGTYRIVLNKEEKTIIIYSDKTDLEPKSVSWNNTKLGINPYTTVIEKLYMYGTFNAFDHDSGAFTGYQDKFNLLPSIADPCVFVYKGDALPRSSQKDERGNTVQASVKFTVDNTNNNVYAFGSSADAKRNDHNGYITAKLGTEEKIVAGQRDNRYAYFIIPEGCNFVVVNIRNNTVLFDKK